MIWHKDGQFHIKIWSCFFWVGDFRNLKFIIRQMNYWFGGIIPEQCSIFKKRNDWDFPSSSRGMKKWIRRTGLQSAVLDRKWSISRSSWSMPPPQEKRKCHHQIQNQKTEVMNRKIMKKKSKELDKLKFSNNLHFLKESVHAITVYFSNNVN